MSEDRLDQLLKRNAREVPLPPRNHEAAFFARIEMNSFMNNRRLAAFVLSGLFAAAAAWFFMVYEAPVITPRAEVVILEESVESYNALLDEGDDIYSLLAMTP
jgi:hypothetical protein